MQNWQDKINELFLTSEVMSNPFSGGIEDKFETYWEQLDFVLKKAQTEPKRNWTLVEGDDGNLYIASGYHLVNRLNYFITHNPCELEYEEYPYFIYEDEEEEEA